MASSTVDGSEDVNDFLQRIKELGERRDQEDEERNRKLEEEILQGRKERQARRAERARSISPTKSSPSNTPTISRVSAASSSTLSQSTQSTIEPREGSEAPETAIGDATEQSTGSPTKENFAPFESGRGMQSNLKQNPTMKPSPSSAMPSRTPTLSWQQRRPNSQASERSRTRPLSMVAAENAARSPRATPEPSTPAEETLSRDQIAQSLAAKDPAWFRQTAVRGLNSPAYRRNQVEDEDRSDYGSNSARIQMPGMSREGSQPEQTEEEPVDKSSSPSRASVSYGNGSRTPGTLTGGLGSHLTLTPAQKLSPPEDTRSEARTLAMSPSQGRISPERLDRPSSPTKGMGGFVQSAMLKRSDSVNKRWSVQSPPGLTRGNSVASNRSSNEPTSGMALGSIPNASVRPGSPSRGSSREPSSRPSSSHSNATITQERPGTSSSMRSSMTTSTTDNGFVKPSLPALRSRTPSGIITDHEETLASEGALPPSPTKRWSPTKSSWLESALNKPDSPKPKPALPPQQPAWMSEITKAKQKSVDLGQGPLVAPKHEVKVGGLIRSPPPGGISKPPSIGGLPTGFSSEMTPKSRPESRPSQESKEYSRSVDINKGVPTSTPSSKPSPIGSKTKPETPLKKDFRAALKPRQPPPSTGGTAEPEFKNVFGQLRRTKTQNYVAPDELKDNITRGKAALNLIGGPKKTERKDEFKEAILKKKDDFKKAQSEGKGITRSTSGGTQDTPLPEALAKRQALGRSSSITASENADNGAVEPSLRQRQEAPKQSFIKEPSAPSRFQGKETIGGKLAGRFNPALAGLLARGPPSVASDTSRSSSPAQSQRTVSMSTSTTNAETPDAGPQLTHMTKGRARGPRRKAPSSAIVVESNENKPTTAKDARTLPQVIPTTKQDIVSRSSAPQEQAPDTDTESPQTDSPRKLDLKRRSQFLQDMPKNNSKTEPKLDSPESLSPTKKAAEVETPVKARASKPETEPATPKAKPSTPVKSPSLKLKPSPKPAEVEDLPETAKLSPKPLSLSPIKILAQHSKPSTHATSRSPPSDQPKSPSKQGRTDSVVSVKSAAAMWSSKTPEESARAKSPIKLPTQDDEKAALVDAGLRSASPEKRATIVGLGIHSVTHLTRPLPTPPTKNTMATSVADFKAKATANSLSPSVPQASEASRLLSEFFGNHKSPPEFATDTASILSAHPHQELKIKTLRSTLYQLSPDGKKQLVPSHQERILFEGNIYLCTHAFGNTAGKKKTEVYYWLGDDVPDMIATEAKIFAQREAKSAGGELVTMRQGKETPEFFSALGGIIITRRGSSNKYDSLAPHILCGRRHFGQIAFDEVDFSAASLCSGFPYLISTQSGKCYLWKGKGSGIDELSCARLIGMDFGITGEIQEVEDGNEPESFLQVFGNGMKIPKSADHWRMKTNYPKYCGRLFLAENTKEQIIEISPFCQSDLATSKIYILDAFFEIYIIVGCRAQSQYDSFHNALMFAQEYGILAAGMEDRPFVPFTTVVMEGVPRDMKGVFRKWRDRMAPTVQTGGGMALQRGRSLRVVGLNAALDATRVGRIKEWGAITK